MFYLSVTTKSTKDRLTSLNLSGNYSGQPSNPVPSITPRQPTVYETFTRMWTNSIVRDVYALSEIHFHIFFSQILLPITKNIFFAP